MSKNCLCILCNFLYECDDMLNQIKSKSNQKQLAFELNLKHELIHCLVNTHTNY